METEQHTGHPGKILIKASVDQYIYYYYYFLIIQIPILNPFNLGMFIVPSCRYVDNAHPLWHNPVLHFITNNYQLATNVLQTKAIWKKPQMCNTFLFIILLFWITNPLYIALGKQAQHEQKNI